jgi:hypothetical protein
MKVSSDSKIWLDYHRVHSKHNTVRAYQFTIEKFNQDFAKTKPQPRIYFLATIFYRLVGGTTSSIADGKPVCNSNNHMVN